MLMRILLAGLLLAGASLPAAAFFASWRSARSRARVWGRGSKPPTPSPTPLVPVADATYVTIAPSLNSEDELAALGFVMDPPAEPEVVAGRMRCRRCCAPTS
jgi:hypothetical protein